MDTSGPQTMNASKQILAGIRADKSPVCFDASLDFDLPAFAAQNPKYEFKSWTEKCGVRCVAFSRKEAASNAVFCKLVELIRREERSLPFAGKPRGLHTEAVRLFNEKFRDYRARIVEARTIMKEYRAIIVERVPNGSPEVD